MAHCLVSDANGTGRPGGKGNFDTKLIVERRRRSTKEVIKLLSLEGEEGRRRGVGFGTRAFLQADRAELVPGVTKRGKGEGGGGREKGVSACQPVAKKRQHPLLLPRFSPSLHADFLPESRVLERERRGKKIQATLHVPES